MTVCDATIYLLKNIYLLVAVSEETWEWPGFGPAPSGGSPPGLPSSSHPPGLQAAGPDSLWDRPEDAPWIASTAASSTASNSLWSAPSWGNSAAGAGSRGVSIWGSSEQAATTPTDAPSPPVNSATYDPFASGIWNPAAIFSPPRPDDDVPPTTIV